MPQSSRPRRLASLDALRGLDLFFLLAFGPVLLSLVDAAGSPVLDGVRRALTHAPWEGFTPWDLIMPLFLFMSGVTIPFALARYRNEGRRREALRRIARRFVSLWLLGMVCQGNLLTLDPSQIRIFSNTLQAIAVGYAASALLYLYTSPRTQLAVCAALLLAYWGAMEFVRIDGFGGGDYGLRNLAERIDAAALGRLRDQTQLVDGHPVTAEWYRYTWILSSLNFAATVLTGLFAGRIVRSGGDGRRTTLRLLAAGAACVAAGWAWGTVHPVIKTIWTGSMVLLSSGWCFLLLGLFYYVIDCRRGGRAPVLLEVYGTNSIAAYVLTLVVSFRCIGHSLLFGLEPLLGPFYEPLMVACNAGVIYALLYLMHRRGIRLKV